MTESTKPSNTDDMTETASATIKAVRLLTRTTISGMRISLFDVILGWAFLYYPSKTGLFGVRAKQQPRLAASILLVPVTYVFHSIFGVDSDLKLAIDEKLGRGSFATSPNPTTPTASPEQQQPGMTQ